MHLLYLPNESTEGDQHGPRAALQKLIQDGHISKLTVFSYRVVHRKIGSWDATLGELLNLIKSDLPSSILVQHIDNYDFPLAFWEKLKSFYPNTFPILAYDERDVYGRIRKPLPKSMIDLCKKCDVIFLVAAGDFAQRFRKFGCKNVHYLPNVATFANFGSKISQNFHRRYDVIMIGNNTKSKLPFLSMPGSIEREKLAFRLSELLGKKFALFGTGWIKNPSNLGPLPFLKQEELLRSSWIAVGADHFYHYEGYFSNRLPITLFSGTPFLMRRTPCVENYLIDGYHCRMYDSVKEAVEICQELLHGEGEALIEMGQRGAEFAHRMLNEELRMQTLISTLKNYEQAPFRKLRG